MGLVEIRCLGTVKHKDGVKHFCGRYLGKVDGSYELYCPVCKTVTKGNTNRLKPLTVNSTPQ